MYGVLYVMITMKLCQFAEYHPAKAADTLHIYFNYIGIQADSEIVVKG